jgi:hypothetical protein
MLISFKKITILKTHQNTKCLTNLMRVLFEKIKSFMLIIAQIN